MVRRSSKKKAGKSAGAENSGLHKERAGIELRREIGQRLKLTRKALYALELAPRWQKDYANSIRLPGSTYNQIESGKQILTPAQAARIYQRYGISLNWIYLGVVDELPSRLVDAIEAEKAKHSRQE